MNWSKGSPMHYTTQKTKREKVPTLSYSLGKCIVWDKNSIHHLFPSYLNRKPEPSPSSLFQIQAFPS